MATVLYEYFRIQNKYFQIPLTPTMNTRIECDNVGMVTNNGDEFPGFFCYGNEWDTNTISIVSLGTPHWIYRFGNVYNTNSNRPFNYGERYSVSIDKLKFQYQNGDDVINASYLNSSTKPLTIGARNDTNTSNVIRMMDGYVGDFRIYDDNVLVMELKPAVNNGQHCYYDTVGDAYYYAQGTGTVDAVNPLHTFTASQSKLSFQSIQSSQNITITAETWWTATTNNSWISLSQNTGSTGDTNVTVTVADGSHDGSRVGKITFTDAEDYTFDVDVFQLKLGMKVYVNKYKVGSTNIVKQQRGEDNVKKMYMGNDLVYQKFAFSPKLSINVDSMVFKYSGDTAQSVTVNSNTNWNYTTDANWLTLTKDGNTLSVLPDDYTSELENRTATITITADNGDIVKTKTISVTQKKISTYTQLEWIRAVNTGTSWDFQAKLNTMVPHTTTDMVIRFKYKWQPNYSSGYSDRMVGYSYQFNDDIATSLYRIFAYSNGSFDNGSTGDYRASYLNLMTTNQYYDITFADNYVYDNINNTYLSNKTPVGSVPTLGCKIFVDLSFPIYGVEIKNGNTLVFDGVPGMDDDGHVGLWDNVTSQLFYNPNYTMTYGEL